jgi:hypothetical protein
MALGYFLFREKFSKLVLLAIGIVFLGISIQWADFSRLPWISVIIATTFAFYGVIKKKSNLIPAQSLVVEGQTDREEIAKRFNLPPSLTSEVIDFLIERGLCLYEDEQIKMGPSRIHLESHSPYIKTRSMDWRMKGLERMDHKEESELFFTAPFSISKEGALKIRELLNKLVQEVSSKVTSNKPQELRCLNIDYFKF